MGSPTCTYQPRGGYKAGVRFQKSNPINERKSTFGLFLKRKAKITDKYLENIYKTNHSSSMSYGTANDKIARQAYIRDTNRHAHDIGLVVHPDLPYLGATPDGKVCNNGTTGILEISAHIKREIKQSKRCVS